LRTATTHHPTAGRHGAGAQDGGDEVVRLAVEDEQRVVHVLAVVAVVAAVLLVAVGRVVGAIQVEQEVGGATTGAEPLALLQIDAHQRRGQPITRVCRGISMSLPGRRGAALLAV
jgi:hypothetical protein